MADLYEQGNHVPDKPAGIGETPEHAAIHEILRVLIVEDTMEIGEIIKAALKGMNISAVHEPRGSTALQTFQTLHPDIVLLDIGLPDMSGWRVLDLIKDLPSEVRRPAVVIITAYGDPANRLMGKLQGVHSYLVKPFTLDQVRSVVRKIIAESARTESVSNAIETVAKPLAT